MRNKYIPIIIGLTLTNLLLAWGVYAQVGTQGRWTRRVRPLIQLRRRTPWKTFTSA